MLVRFLHELGVLKLLQRSGWCFIGEREGDSVAAHSFRAAFIAYHLAKRVGVDPFKAAFAALLHDVAESRTGDVHKLASAYVRREEERALQDMLEGTGMEELKALFHELKKGESLLARVVKDADRLELFLQAKEYMAKGNGLARSFYESAKKDLSLEEARALAEEIEKAPLDWWAKV